MRDMKWRLDVRWTDADVFDVDSSSDSLMAIRERIYELDSHSAIVEYRIVKMSEGRVIESGIIERKG